MTESCGNCSYGCCCSCYKKGNTIGEKCRLCQRYDGQSQEPFSRDDPQYPYYWVCQWKDKMVDKMRLIKPIFKEPDFYHNVPLNLIISTSDMIPYWMNNNHNMNLYLIHIKFNTFMSVYGQQIEFKNYFNYKSYNDKKWCCCYRNILSNGDPVCTPL
jgi:hypothetical protein